MATTITHHYSIHPGRESAGVAISDKIRVCPSEGPFGFHASGSIAAMEGKVLCVGWGGHMQFIPAQWGGVIDNTGTINYAASTVGVKFNTQAAPADNDDNSLVSFAGALVRSSTPNNAQWFKCSCRFQLSSVANLGFVFGWVTQGSTEIFTAAPVDGVYVIKAKNSAQFVLRVIQNSAAAVDQNITLTGVDATDFVMNMEFCIGAASDGSDTAAAIWINGVRTTFTAAQAVALYNLLLTSPPTLSAILATRLNGTTQRNGIGAWSLFEADR